MSRSQSRETQLHCVGHARGKDSESWPGISALPGCTHTAWMSKLLDSKLKKKPITLASSLYIAKKREKPSFRLHKGTETGDDSGKLHPPTTFLFAMLIIHPPPPLTQNARGKRRKLRTSVLLAPSNENIVSFVCSDL